MTLVVTHRFTRALYEQVYISKAFLAASVHIKCEQHYLGTFADFSLYFDVIGALYVSLRKKYSGCERKNICLYVCRCVCIYA